MTEYEDHNSCSRVVQETFVVHESVVTEEPSRMLS
jgi:hypothetical protein